MLFEEDGREFFADSDDIWFSLSLWERNSCLSSALGVSASSGITSTAVSILPGAKPRGDDLPEEFRRLLWGETPSKEMVVVIVPLYTSGLDADDELDVFPCEVSVVITDPADSGALFWAECSYISLVRDDIPC